jgi:hypothetical protein
MTGQLSTQISSTVCRIRQHIFQTELSLSRVESAANGRLVYASSVDGLPRIIKDREDRNGSVVSVPDSLVRCPGLRPACWTRTHGHFTRSV